MMTLESHLERQIEYSSELFWHRVRLRAVADYLPRDGRPFKLLDVGAGAGFLGAFLADRYPGATYRFDEPLEPLERHLESRYGARANARGLEQLNGVDRVALLDVLEHQVDDVAFLRSLAQRLPRGSVLVLTVPALPSLWSGWDRALGHYRRYTKKLLRSRIETIAELQILELSYLFPELVPLGWLRRHRNPDRAAVMASNGEAAFPDLPATVNHALYAVGIASLKLRRVWPVGTSLFAATNRI